MSYGIQYFDFVSNQYNLFIFFAFIRINDYNNYRTVDEQNR